MNVYDEAHEALTPQRAFEEECLSKGCVERLAKVVGDHLQPKVNALRELLLVHQMKDLEVRMYDAGADLPVIQFILSAAERADLNTRSLVHDGLKAWLDLLDERA